MKHVKLILLALSISLLGLIVVFSGTNHGNVYAYYSPTGNLYSLGLYGGGLGMYGMYGGLYGGGLYGGGLYGGGLYGGGLYGMYGGLYGGGLYGGLLGMYGGLYGGGFYGGLLSMYGGLYGGGLYGGLLGMYGGLYGGGLYGMYGGLYGGGLYGMGGMGDIYSLLLLNQLLGGQDLLTTPSVTAAPVTTPIEPTATIAALAPLVPIFIGEQAAGTWVGTWISSTAMFGTLPITQVSTGDITLNIIEDLDTGILAGQAVFALHPILGAGVELTGSVSNNFITLAGLVGAWYTPTLLDVTITGTLISPFEMTGTYQLVLNNNIVDIGTFEATLLPPIAI